MAKKIQETPTNLTREELSNLSRVTTDEMCIRDRIGIDPNLEKQGHEENYIFNLDIDVRFEWKSKMYQFRYYPGRLGL